MKKILLAIIMAMVLAGCQTFSQVTSNDVLVQYSTMKLIEQSDSVTSEGVLSAMQKARETLNTDVTFTVSEFKEELAEKIHWSTLPVSDRILISTIVDKVQERLEEKYEVDVISDQTEIRLLDFIENVEQAAALSKE